MADPKTPPPPDDPPPTVFGVPIRVDATLADPGEIWLEQPDGEAVRVWPPSAPPEDSHG